VVVALLGVAVFLASLFFSSSLLAKVVFKEKFQRKICLKGTLEFGLFHGGWRCRYRNVIDCRQSQLGQMAEFPPIETFYFLSLKKT
jgi:hypothetical protein